MILKAQVQTVGDKTVIYLVIYLVWPHQIRRSRCSHKDLAVINPWRSPSRVNVFFPMLFWKVSGTFVPGNESSRERKFQNFRPLVSGPDHRI